MVEELLTRLAATNIATSEKKKLPTAGDIIFKTRYDEYKAVRAVLAESGEEKLYVVRIFRVHRRRGARETAVFGPQFNL